MSNDPQNVNSTGHGSYERSDIGVSAVVYFLVGLAVAMLLVYFIVDGIYHYLDNRFEAEQTPVSPLVAKPPADTRHLPKEYNGNYEQYLKENFPSPQLEVNERTELNAERQREENTLSTYDYIDKNAGTVRIPIDRAMDLLAQRGLPVRNQAASAAPEKARGTKK